MNDVEFKLWAAFRGAPAVRLEDICDQYLGLSWAVARNQAALNLLPFPTFRLGGSQKAPLMVQVKDLARHIEEAHQCAKASWEKSQV